MMEPAQSREKVFDLKRRDDPQTKIIIGARTQALEDPDLTDGAKTLFCRLLDLSLDPEVNNGRRGEILISTTQLSERLKRSARAIWGWKKELVGKRFIWITKQPRPNMHPMHRYHITALQPERQVRQEVAGDGLWGNGYRRPEQIMPQGARGLTGTKRHLLVDRFGNPLFSNSPNFAVPTGTKQHLPPASSAGGSGRTCRCHPQVLREEPERNNTSPPQVLRVAPASSAGGSGTKQHPLQESEIEKESLLEKGEVLSPQEKAFQDWITGLKASKPYAGALDKIRTDLVGKLHLAKGEKARKEWRRRIAAVDELRLGPAVADETKKTDPVRQAPKPAEKTLSEDELLEGGRLALAINKPGLLSQSQKAALARVGEL